MSPGRRKFSDRIEYEARWLRRAPNKRERVLMGFFLVAFLVVLGSSFFGLHLFGGYEKLIAAVMAITGALVMTYLFPVGHTPPEEPSPPKSQARE